MTRTMIAAAALSLLGASTALAGPQFTADTVQMQPGQEIRSGKLFVSDKGVRFEYQQDDGQMVAQVLLPSKNVMRVLFPVTRTYMEIDVPHGASLVETRPDVPCKASAEVDCVKEGDDPANAGLVRWTIRTRTPQTMVRVWWDAKRKMAVREEYMDGRVMQATLRGSETYEGRAVEGWETVYLTPNGQYRRAMSLYSAELGLSVVDQMPGGSVRQLRNIQIGAPDPKLFVIPENYKKVETPVDAELARITPPEAQPSAPKTDARMTPQAGAQPTQPAPQQQPQAPQQPGAFGPQSFMPQHMPMPMPQMQGPGMMIVPPAQPEVQPQAQPQPPAQPQQQPQAQSQPHPQAQPQPNAAGSFPGAAPWQQPPFQGPAPQWAQPGNGQPQSMQPPMYPGYGPQPMPPSPYTYPGQPTAPTSAPQGKGANAAPAPAPAPSVTPTPPSPSAAGQQPNSLSHYTDWGGMPPAPAAPQTGDAQPSAPTPPAYPGYGMWPGQFGPYGPGYPVQPGYPAQPTAPAPDKSSASAAGTAQVAPGTPNSTSAKGAKEP